MLADDLFNSVYMSCKSLLVRIVSRIVPPHEVEDIVQETYVKVYQFKSRGEIKHPRALMVKTARNLALDHIKRAETRLADSTDFDDMTNLNEHFYARDNPLQQVVSDEEFARFCEAVRILPQQCRKVFVLKKVYGHSQKEISVKLKISQSTVEKHVAKGMKLCHQHMRQYESDDIDQSARKSVNIERGSD